MVQMLSLGLQGLPDLMTEKCEQGQAPKPSGQPVPSPTNCHYSLFAKKPEMHHALQGRLSELCLRVNCENEVQERPPHHPGLGGAEVGRGAPARAGSGCRPSDTRDAVDLSAADPSSVAYLVESE